MAIHRILILHHPEAEVGTSGSQAHLLEDYRKRNSLKKKKKSPTSLLQNNLFWWVLPVTTAAEVLLYQNSSGTISSHFFFFFIKAMTTILESDTQVTNLISSQLLDWIVPCETTDMFPSSLDDMRMTVHNDNLQLLPNIKKHPQEGKRKGKLLSWTALDPTHKGKNSAVAYVLVI